jgi:hypothetical protein
MPRRFWLLVPLVIGATAAISAWAVGIVAPGSVVDPDFLFRPVPFLDRHGGLLALVGAVVVVAVGVSWGASPEGMRRSGWFAAVAALLAGAWIGTTYAVATMPVVGANIGGVLMLLLTAPMLVGVVIVMVGAQAGDRRRGRSSDGASSDRPLPA